MASEDYTIAYQNAIYFLTYTITDWVDAFIRSFSRMVVIELQTQNIKPLVANEGDLRLLEQTTDNSSKILSFAGSWNNIIDETAFDELTKELISNRNKNTHDPPRL